MVEDRSHLALGCFDMAGRYSCLLGMALQLAVLQMLLLNWFYEAFQMSNSETNRAELDKKSPSQVMIRWSLSQVIEYILSM